MSRGTQYWTSSSVLLNQDSPHSMQMLRLTDERTNEAISNICKRAEALQSPGGNVAWHRTVDQDRLMKGRFTKAEDIVLEEQLARVAKERGYGDVSSYLKQICHTGKSCNGDDWKRICEALPSRHMESVVQRVQSQYYPWPRAHKPWGDVEVFYLIGLCRYYKKDKRIDWREVATKIQRCPRHCSDKYRYLEQSGFVAKVSNEQLDSIMIGDELREGYELSDSMPEKPVVNRTLWDKQAILKLENAVFEATGSRTSVTGIPWGAIQKKYFPDVPSTILQSRHWNSIESVHKLRPIVKVRCILRYLRSIITKMAEEHPKVPLHWEDIDWSWCAIWHGRKTKQQAKVILLAGIDVVKRKRYSKMLFVSEQWKRVALALHDIFRCDEWEIADREELAARLVTLSRLSRMDPKLKDEDGSLVRIPPDTQAEAVNSFIRKLRIDDESAVDEVPVKVEGEDDMLWSKLGFNPRCRRAVGGRLLF